MAGESRYVIVQTTIDSRERAQALAGAIVASRLAACVHMAPIQSVYHWKGSVEESEEYVLTAKTRRACAERLSAFIAQRHAYEVPEIVVLPITGGGASYLAWIDQETAGADEQNDG